MEDGDNERVMHNCLGEMSQSISCKSLNDSELHSTAQSHGAEAVKKYGWIEHVELFDDITVTSSLMIKGLELLSSVNYDEMVLEVSAVDLHDLDIDTEAINLLDKIRVVSEVHDLDAYFPVTKISIPLDNPADKKFTLGVKTTKAITDTNTIGG
jgi:hypothetical protein